VQTQANESAGKKEITPQAAQKPLTPVKRGQNDRFFFTWETTKNKHGFLLLYVVSPALLR